MSTSSGITASSLCAPLFDGPEQTLVAVHRSSVAWQLADQQGRVVMCVTKSSAVRLPHVVVVPCLPSGSSPVSVGDGTLGWDGRRHRVSRWWQPARPVHPLLRQRLDDCAVGSFTASWQQELGLGAGLTPYADDVVCGALVLLRAAKHPDADVIAHQLQCFDLERRTTATSAALLRFAAAGWCIDPLAAYLSHLASGVGQTDLLAQALRDVGHSSGAGLLEGVHLLMRDQTEGVAA